MNIRLHSAAFRGYGIVRSGEVVTPEVEVQASGSQCNAVVLVGDTSYVVPCTFRFEAPLDEQLPCTGVASGRAFLSVELPRPDGFTHDFVYDAHAVVDDTSIHGFGTAEMDVGSLDVRTGWVKFDAVPPECNVLGPDAGIALY